jgi:uncharacterized membrane protein
MPPQLAPDDSLRAAGSAFEIAGGHVDAAVQWLRLGIEAMGAIVIALGVVVGTMQFARASIHRTPHGYNAIRLTIARYLAVALEFQLAADLLSTAIAPSWTAIGKLAAIAAVRTGLNYFLGREIREVKGADGSGEGRPSV